ncbi:MAG: S8 family serine peptidase [Vulcanimicrobiota bacterium]
MKYSKAIFAILLVLSLFLGIQAANAREEAGLDDFSLAATDPAYENHPYRVEGGIIVDFKDKTPMDEIEKLEKDLGVDLSFSSIFSEDDRFMTALVNEYQVDDILGKLRKNPNVEYAEPDYYFHIFGEQVETEAARPNDPMYKYQWNFEKINARGAWDLTRGNGVTVAVIDTGVAYKTDGQYHKVEDLENTHFVKGYNFVDNNDKAYDDHAHGTHVAGTIAQSTNNGKGVAGIAYKARIMPLKVLNRNGFGKVSDIADAIRYATDNGAKVINMSLGGPFPSLALKSACSYAWNRGVVIICAAGNSRSTRPHYPSGYSECVSVSATRFDDKLAPYSNRGKSITIAAPGGDTTVDQNGDGKPDGVLQNTIQVKNPSKEGYYIFQGTSMASPHAAAVAALIISSGVTNNREVVNILKKTARRGSLPLEEGYGSGIIDARAAVYYSMFTRGWIKLIIAVIVLITVIIIFGSMANSIKFSPRFYIGFLIGAGALFFLPLLLQGKMFPGMGILSRSFSEWDSLIFGASAQGNPIFYSMIIPFIIAVICYKTELQRIAAGFTLGVAGNLAYHTLLGGTNVQWIPGILLDKIWLVLNVVVGIVIAYVLISQLNSAKNKETALEGEAE